MGEVNNLDPIENQILETAKKVSRGTETVEKLSEIRYLPGLEERVAYLPILESLPLSNAFTWGRKSENMYEKYRDKSETTEDIKKRNARFLASIEANPSQTIYLIGVFEGEQKQIVEVDRNTEGVGSGENKVMANFVYTKDPEVALTICPADCAISIIYAKDREGKNILGLVHSSARSTNNGIPRLAIEHLIQQEGVDPASIVIGIAPAISKNHYAISQEADVLKHKRLDPTTVEYNWANGVESHIEPKDPSKGDEQKRAVDIIGATIMQFVEGGVNSQNIQAYSIDTYQAAEREDAFSRQYSVESGKPQGRFIVAAQLKHIW